MKHPPPKNPPQLSESNKKRSKTVAEKSDIMLGNPLRGGPIPQGYSIFCRLFRVVSAVDG